MKMTKPMMNADFSSESMNAGMSVVSGTSSGLAGRAVLLSWIIVASSSLRVCLSMNVRSGFTPSSKAWRLADLALEVGLQRLVVHLRQRPAP